MPVRLTRTAPADLIDIRAHIARENPHAASRVAVPLLAASDCLERLPRRGRPGRVAGTWQLVAQYPYAIVFEIAGADIIVRHIRHGARRPSGH